MTRTTDTYRPPHAVCDDSKLDALVEAFRTNQPIPPIVVIEDLAICGSHRIAAHEIASREFNRLTDGWEDADEPTLNVIELTADYAEYLDSSDYNGICEAIYDATDRDDVKVALEDQC